MSKNKKRVYLRLAAVMVIMVAVEVLFAHPHHHMVWNLVPGFDLLIGFAGAWALIILAKIFMAKLLQRDENYYDAESLGGHILGGHSDSDVHAVHGSASGKDGDGNA